MIKIENVVTPSPAQWETVIMGARNPMNSWDKSDSFNCEECNGGLCRYGFDGGCPVSENSSFVIGPNDYSLLMRLRKAGAPSHRKFLRMLPIHVTVTAPLYWYKEFDTYKVGTVANSCSTMHKIHAKEFTLDDFSTDKLHKRSINHFKDTIELLNDWRNIYLNGGMVDNYDGTARIYESKDKDAWWQMIQLLPSSYNQKRIVMLNYEVLANIYHDRKNHKLDEWVNFCEWIDELPYSELITGGKEDETAD